MAKTANNKRGGKSASRGKSSAGAKASGGKSTQTKKAVAKRDNAKSARGKAQAAAKARSSSGGERKGIVRFFHDVRVEMGKVTWPTRSDLIQSTIVVLVAVAIATVFTGVVDLGFEKLVDAIIHLM